jgi:hypothetical protein
VVEQVAVEADVREESVWLTPPNERIKYDDEGLGREATLWKVSLALLKNSCVERRVERAGGLSVDGKRPDTLLLGGVVVLLVVVVVILPVVMVLRRADMPAEQEAGAGEGSVHEDGLPPWCCGSRLSGLVLLLLLLVIEGRPDEVLGLSQEWFTISPSQCLDLSRVRSAEFWSPGTTTNSH